MVCRSQYASEVVIVCMTLDQVDFNDLPGANQRIRDARLQVRDTRVQLTEAMSSLRAMQAEFIAAAKTI